MHIYIYTCTYIYTLHRVGIYSDKSSDTLRRGYGSCSNKANVLVSILRALQVPAGWACCSVLQCVAVCCSVFSVLQCVAVCCGVSQHVAMRCNVLQCVALSCALLHLPQRASMCCRVLQCVAECCSVLQCVAECCTVRRVLYCAAVCCCALQCVVVCCCVLQCFAVYIRDSSASS